jgi:NADH-quinone oxidoreductase subunit L
VVGGGLNLPVHHDLHFLADWLHPVLEFMGEPTEAHIAVSTGTKVGLAAVATVAALTGILAAAAIYLQHRREAVEPEVLARGWYYDETLTRVVGGPGRAAFDGVSSFDRTVVDGAVDGAGGLVRLIGTKLRVVQNGYVRSYALGIAVGAVILVGLFLGRAGI